MRLSSTVKVVLESPDGNAVFTFSKPKLNEQLKVDEVEGESQTEKLKRQLSQYLKNLISVEGLEHENGKPVQKEEILSLDLDQATIFAIITGYNLAVNKPLENPEKKDSASA